MKEILERAQSLVATAEQELRSLIPAEAGIFDVHVHVGSDIDGFVSHYEDLAAFLRADGVARAFCFCMDEPDRHPAFRAANDRTLAAEARSAGLLIPFARLDLGEGPVEEATRALDRGARGIKLHPRSQSFTLSDERLEPIFALAAERRVPILIHGGRGLPPIATDLRRLVDRHPETQLIIAHAGIADLAALSKVFAGRPGVFFDTSVWSTIDLLDLFCRVAPEQVVYGSDFPYAQRPDSLLIALRAARVAGLDEDEISDVLGRTAMRIADGQPPRPLTAPRAGARTLVQPITFARIHSYIAMATPLLWTRQPDVVGALGLAINTCRERDGHVETRERIAELLTCARELWRSVADVEDDAERRTIGHRTFQLIHLADIEAVTAVA